MTPLVGRWLARMRHLLRNLLRRPRVERDLDAELDAYRELLIEEKLAQGLRPEDAQRAARIEIGGADGVKEAVRDVRAGAWLDAIRRDMRVGVRALLRRPGFASIAIVTLAVGIGATTAIFSLIDSVLLRPLPFPDPDRLVMVWEVKPRFNAPRVEAAPLNYVDWQRQATSFEHLAAYVGQFAALTGDGEPERLDIVQATPNLLQLLGVEPALGRWFLAPEGAPGQAGVVVLSYGLWQRRYGADPGILGRSIRLDGEPHQVVGVMPRGFQFPRDGIDAWIPVDYAAGAGAQARASFFLQVVGRLKPAVTVAQANAELGAIAERLAATYPENVGSSAFAVPLQQDLVRDTRTSLLLLMAAALLVLLIACANVAGLLVTRSAERDREFAVRSALGAGRLQLARQLVLEGVLLAGIGAALGLVLATQTFAVLERLIPATLRGAVAPTLDLRLLGVTLAAVLLTGIVFGLVPLRHARKMDLRTPLNDRTTVAASGRRRMQAALVASEVALAVVVLFSAGLMIRTIANLLAVDPGFRVENALTARVGLSPADYPTTERQNTFYREVVERVTSLPGIVSAGFITFLPYTAPIGAAPLRVEGRPDPGNGTNITIVRAVTPEYFEALGLPLIKGRAFSDRDVTASQDVAIISERAAALFEGEPVGQRVTFRGDEGLMTVVGVVGDVNGEGIEAPETRGIVYVPSTQMGAAGFFSPRSLVVRTASDPAAFVDAVRQQIWAVNPNETIDEVRTLESLVGAQAGNRRVQTWLFTAFGSLALFMAALGVYGLLSFVVTMRTRELGVRSAVGAQRRDLVKLIAGDSALWVLCGLAGGLALSAIVSRRMSALIYGVEPLDLVSLAGAVGVLGVVATAAALRPVWRASRLDPAAVLRSE